MRLTLCKLLVALSVVLAGCENAGEPDPYVVVVDSTVNAKLNEHRARMSARNDSILNALEMARADSLVNMAKPTSPAKDTTGKNLPLKK